MNIQSDIPPNSLDVPRAVGRAKVGIAQRKAKITALFQSGSLKVLFPHAADKQQAVIINTAGGITGGDQFQIDAAAQSGACLTLTTQAAERAYRAQDGQIGQLRTRLQVGAASRLNWLPQETILFDGCALHRSLHIDLAPDASLTLCEPVIFGRTAMGESVTKGIFQDEIRIFENGAPIFTDRTSLNGDIANILNRHAVLNGAGAMCLIVHKSKDAGRHIDQIRALLPDTGAASVIRDDLMIIRAVAYDSFLLRQCVIPILTRLTDAPLPRPWMI